MILASVFNRRLRGFRVIELLAVLVVGVLALGSYVFTTFAGAQVTRITGVESQITEEDKRIHLLRAEIAHLEDPSRIERLSTQYLHLQPVDPKHDIGLDALPQAASAPAPVATPQKQKS
jgi:cell division protein FtsL